MRAACGLGNERERVRKHVSKKRAHPCAKDCVRFTQGRWYLFVHPSMRAKLHSRDTLAKLRSPHAECLHV